jgi:hypothetical protein
LLGPEGAYAALAPAAEGPGGQGRQAFLGLASRLPGGRFLATGQGNSFFSPPPGVEARRLRGRPYAEIVTAHEAWVAERRGEIEPLRADEVEGVILDLSRRQAEANAARGIYVPATEDEMALCERGAGLPSR